MAETKKVEIKPAKGRPMLQWVGKKPLRDVIAYPAQLVETFAPNKAPQTEKNLWKEWPENFPHSGLLFHGDNKDVLAYLLANGFRGKVKLIYIDPPFDSGADYVRKVNLRGSTARLESEGYTIGEQIQYTDIWANDNYLQFMYERLLLLRELLSEDGSIALHCDAKRNHFLRLLLDEVFNPANFRGEIIVRAGVKNVQSQFEELSSLTLGNNTVYLYSKDSGTKYVKLHAVSNDYEPGKWDTFWRGTDRHTMRYKFFGQKPESGQWRWAEKRAQIAVENYEKFQREFASKVSLDEYYLNELEKGSDLDFVRLSEDKVVQYYVPPRKYKLLSNVWLDIPYRGTVTDYPTEKNEAIVERLISWITVSQDIVLDCFIGSGTASAVAQKLGRRWIAADINKGAIQTTSKRLQGIIEEQIKSAKKNQPRLPLLQGEGEGEGEITPAQYSFSVYRVNDYDLQVQHNEVMNLACEHLGITRTKTDAFFDGMLGKKLVKIVPFNHPITPLDLEEVKRELGNRPQEDRDVVVVGYGKELAVQEWLDNWNRNRKRTALPNQIEIKDLRVNAKSGGFFVHKSAEAKVKFMRAGEKVSIEIEDFLSPTVIERLRSQAGVLTPQIKDWRSMVDCVMVDSNHDGKVFNITLADVPEKKNDLVEGKYEVVAKEGSTIAVKITDMLGEEVLVVKEV